MNFVCSTGGTLSKGVCGGGARAGMLGQGGREGEGGRGRETDSFGGAYSTFLRCCLAGSVITSPWKQL